jgi:hypothetical protein
MPGPQIDTAVSRNQANHYIQGEAFMLNASQVPQTAQASPAPEAAPMASDGNPAPAKPRTRPSHNLLWWLLVAVAIII